MCPREPKRSPDSVRACKYVEITSPDGSKLLKQRRKRRFGFAHHLNETRFRKIGETMNVDFVQGSLFNPKAGSCSR